MKCFTQDEWLAKGNELFGEELKEWKWVCPACGRVTSGKEFDDLGKDPNFAFQNCIGRCNGNMKPADPKNKKNNLNGCDWTAGGLFILDGCYKVTTNEGKEVIAFPFYEGEPK